ncbi:MULTISPECIES: type VII secretion protein EccC [Streptomycetaceae]|uniref:ATP/GTP binding protein n=1 Tax=Streptantibioticus cattleyicolor (strain ATCC 35852 / DSM 46488 / JCM 4925 / NBRC 14057 / NRRL 8057) TaxID=1003195 RepID=F8JUP3_STREN|nr:type VII secretion protein EccC [Streptantibioticus cattleyicolor]AEW96872.1 ATP/GTP binding protein [Streptantibioticus cattleyicolor NRRL 8057 = DSM 46488]MYS61350.1 type VII secretion protein EccC [Streptomyces sp. SID5468]CCB77201.1 ATP/GTP binding protein [Streptantibioticus cattleyicolor NRRL 8057 = DSM 46488]
MSVVVVKRPPRVAPPEVPAGEVRLETPPELPRDQEQGMLMTLLPMVGMASSAAFFFMPGSAAFMKVMGGLMLASTGVMAVAQAVRVRQGPGGRLSQARRDYFAYLAQVRRHVRRTARAQRAAQLVVHPEPGQLWALVAQGRRVWERRITDEDFAQVRIGLGAQDLATPLVAPVTAPVEELEPLTAAAMRNFLAAHSVVDGLPLAVSLRAFYHVTVSGDAQAAPAAVRALLAQLAALHSPEDLVIAVAAGHRAGHRWEWTKWLPHCQQPKETDGAGSRRLYSDDLAELEEMLADRFDGRPRFGREAPPLLDRPHLVVVLDGAVVPADSVLASAEGLQGVTVLEVVPGELDEPRGGLSVVVHPDRLRLRSPGGRTYEGRPDALSAAEAEALARQLAPLRVGGGDDDEPLLNNLDFTDLLRLGDAASVDVARTWRPRARHDRLRVPIGVGENGEPVLLDLKEAAQDGMGPHGLCVGATGSGKSELLRTLVLGLAVTHSSETLNFVLADFKGGATFAGMSTLPHVAAVITNLADDLALVDRMRDAITGELQRRQEMLHASTFANVHDYEKARAAGAPLPPLPSLVLVIDEFSELLSAKPDFIDMFIQIGRIGRSLGVHLLLASQRLEEGRLRGLDTYLSYRIGLRTFSASESRAALGVPDAYHLPSVPGSGYLKFGTDTMVRFKAAYVSGVYRGSGVPAAVGPVPAERRPVLFTAGHVPVVRGEPVPVAPQDAHAPTDADAFADTVLDVVVRRLEGQGPPAHQVWLPPLGEAPALDQLFSSPLAVHPVRGLTVSEPEPAEAPGRLVVPVGLVDQPFQQRRDVLRRDFSGAAGHALVVGGPRSGKSTLLRTLIGAFALTHTPAEAQFYCLDFGGGGLAAVEGLPHVGGVAARLDGDKVRRTVAEVAGVLARRELLFRREGIDSMTTYRKRRAAGELPGEPWGDVFLVIDGWNTLKADFEALEPVVGDIAARGLGFGVHVVISAARYMEVRPALKDLLLSRFELRLGDPADSEIDRRTAVNVPVGAPGRGLTPERLHFLTALPRVDGAADPAGSAEATAAFVRSVARGWTGPSAPQVRMLPTDLPAARLPRGFEHPDRGVAIGIDENDLEPVFIDFDTDPLFLVYGESESGKTALLRLLVKQISERWTPEEALIVVGDYRRGLLGAVPDSHLLQYSAAPNTLQEHMEQIATIMARRVPGPDVTARQLRERNWWSGPQAFVVIDDYDLVATSTGNPMLAVVEHLPYARDIGVRFIVARNSAGAGRSSYETFTQRFKELGAQGLVLSGDPAEGELLGPVRARPLPPGRGVLVSRRRGNRLVQTGWLPAQ